MFACCAASRDSQKGCARSLPSSDVANFHRCHGAVRHACTLLLRHARFGYPRLDTELGRLATSASVRHSVWKRRERSFSLADRVGVALERCPGLPSCWRLARTSSRESGLWLELRLRIRKTRPITRCGSMVEGGSTGRRLAASRRASSYLFLESAAGADERARLGREPQPHEKHIPRRAWSVRGGRGRFGAPAMPRASGQASSQVVRIACPSSSDHRRRREGVLTVGGF